MLKSLRPKEQNIKCCQILGSVAGSLGAQNYEFSRMRAQFFLCRSEASIFIDANE